MIRKIFQNSVSNVGIMFLKMATAFVLTPCIVHALGNYDYGIYEIVMSLIGYMGMLQLGMQPAVTKFVASYASKGDEEALKTVFSSALVFSLIMGTAVSLCILLWALAGAKGIAGSATNSSRYIIFLLIVACQVMVSFPGNVIESVHHGHQRYWLTAVLTTINTITGTSILYVLLKSGYGLIALTAANAIGVSVKYFNYGLLLRRKSYGGYLFSAKHVSKSTMRELLAFGSKSFVLGIATRIRNSTDSLVLGVVIGPAVVAYYMIPCNLVSYLRNTVAALSLGFMPMFSEIYSLDGVGNVRRYYLALSKYIIAASSCALLCILFLGTKFIGLWMGTEYATQGRGILFIMAAVFALQLPNIIQGRVLTGMGEHGWLARIKTFEALFNLGISALLAKWIGKEGVALGTLIPACVIEPLSLIIMGRVLNTTFKEYTLYVLSPLVLPLGVTSAYFYMTSAALRAGGYLEMAVIGSVGILIYFLLYYLFLSSDESRIMTHHFRRIFFRKKSIPA